MRSKKNPSLILKDLNEKGNRFWMKERESRCLSLFIKAAEGVPGYNKFLKKHKIDYTKIKTWENFKLVPTTSKEHYLKKYPYEEVFWDGNLDKSLVYTSSSGSTGMPFYFARSNTLDWQHSVISELFIRQRYSDKNSPALFMICFGMGIWIGGLINFKSMDMLAQRENLPLSIITPGINMKEIMNILKNIAPRYKQVILAGYPPFLKDVIDKANRLGINLKRLNLRIIFAAEAISEEFKDCVAERASIKDVYTDIINIYGSAELGAMAYETQVCTLIKKIAQKNKEVKKVLFSKTDKYPTLAQFIPYFTNFEADGDKVLVTGNSAIPLIRYDIGDNGGVISYKEMRKKLKGLKIDLKKEAIKAGLGYRLPKMPFVYIYERADLSTSFYGLCVYPDWIKPTLLKKPLSNYFTGRFTLRTKLDRSKNQYMEINLEMVPKKRATLKLKESALNEIISGLKESSSEYREICNHLKERALPRLVFWKYHHEKYFGVGIKQKWVKNS